MATLSTLSFRPETSRTITPKMCIRDSFYVGNGVKNEDVHAKFENGVLRLSIPKKAAEEIEADKYVSIEG